MSDVKSTILGFPNRSFHSVSDITFFLWSKALYYYFIFVFEFFFSIIAHFLAGNCEYLQN